MRVVTGVDVSDEGKVGQNRHTNSPVYQQSQELFYSQVKKVTLRSLVISFSLKLSNRRRNSRDDCDSLSQCAMREVSKSVTEALS